MFKRKDFFTKKLEGFTLPELVIVMLLTALIFILLSVVYSIFMEDSARFRKKVSYYSEYYLFNKAIRNDIRNAESIRKVNDKTVLLSLSSNQINYIFDSTFAVRNIGTHSDTFRMGALLDSVGYYNNESGLINTLRLEFLYGKKHFYNFENKIYTSSQILNYTDSTNEQAN